MPSTPAAAIMVPYCERKLGGSGGDRLGPLRKVCISPSDTVSSSRALAWCQDPRLTGTFAISVVTPSATCSAAEDYVAACLSSFGFANIVPGELKACADMLPDHRRYASQAAAVYCQLECPTCRPVTPSRALRSRWDAAGIGLPLNTAHVARTLASVVPASTLCCSCTAAAFSKNPLQPGMAQYSSGTHCPFIQGKSL